MSTSNRHDLLPPIVVIWAFAGLAACASSESDAVYTTIDDMEGTSGIIEWTPPTGQPGGWDTFTDTESDRILPLPHAAGGTWSYEAVPTPYQTRPGVTSSHAARVRTTAPLVNQYGGGMGFDLSDLAVDLSPYKGISFWGMATAGAGAMKASIRIDDGNTDPRGGICDPSPSASPQQSCYGSFTTSVDLTSTFTQYTVYFSDLRQGDFGHHAATGVVDVSKVYSLSFQVDTPGGSCFAPAICAGAPPTLTFDIWIDDLYFVNK